MKRPATTSAVLIVTIVVMLAGCSRVEPDPSPSPSRYTGRVELADEGVALTLDPNWWAEPAPSYEGLIPPPTHEIVLQAFYEDGPGWCDLWVDRSPDQSSGSLIAYTEQLIRDYERDPDITGSSEPLSLPAGPATRVWIKEGTVNPEAHTEYVLQHDGVFYRLACLLNDPRHDDWLSVAEGIEFLSEEE